MAEGLEHPERLLGMHFFNPVALMPLVELVRTTETDDVSLATAWSVADRLRKRPVLVNDAPGFVVNRLLARMMVVLLDEIERGNTVEETDEAVLGLGLPMAPSVLLQMVGEQVANHVRETLHDAYPDRFAITGDGPVRSVDEIREAVLAALADEVRHMLEEGVVESPKDVDTALILGAGFPFFMGGLTPRLREAGYSFELSPRYRLSESTTIRRRSRALPGGRLADTETARSAKHIGRLLKPRNNAPARKEGAHGGTRGSPVKASGAKRESGMLQSDAHWGLRARPL